MESDVRCPTIVRLLLDDEMVFRPAPPGDADAWGNGRLRLPSRSCPVDATDDQMRTVGEGLRAGALSEAAVHAVLDRVHAGPALRQSLPVGPGAGPAADGDRSGRLAAQHHLDRLALVAVELVDRVQHALLDEEPLTEIRFELTGRAKAALALGWTAMASRGLFPLPPRGKAVIDRVRSRPAGAMHFVSASDQDAGYLYTLGIALSPEAQANRSTEVGYGLDGEMIVPGQAVSPIPPFLALATRLSAASVPTSSNISEEEQSIPMRNFPHPTAIDDLHPVRGGKFKPPVRPRTPDEAITDLRLQLSRFHAQERRGDTGTPRRPELAAAVTTAEARVGAAYDVTGLSRRQITAALAPVLADPVLAAQRELIALYLDVEQDSGDRVDEVCAVVDAAGELGLRFVAVADDAEDEWLPNLLEYLEPDELDAIADHADAQGVLVVDGRPVDPLYTAATAAQRIQSVYTTLSVDVLKMGMWLCLDALTARKVWQEIRSNPHIPEHMMLMPIGIVEPWNAFVDNRDPTRTARPVLDPFRKITFMIEEAAVLGAPSLLTDTRHKETWVLLGRRTETDEPHRREHFLVDQATGEVLGRTPDSAIPLLSWAQFMECERLARAAGIVLGQAGSIESEQAFRIISDVTLDAARQGRNPATAFWTAETERTLHVGAGADGGRTLQQERSSDVSPFLAVVNRGYESHAKVDGWLRFLADRAEDGEALARNNKLRADLANRKDRLDDLLASCLAGQRHDPATYQLSWDAFRAAYVEYHDVIKSSFLAVRRQVESAWTDVPQPAHASGGGPR